MSWLKRGERIKNYVDKIVVHTDKQQPTNIPSIEEGDKAIAYIVELIDLYYSYFRGVDPGDRQPNFQYDWKEVFRHPWIDD